VENGTPQGAMISPSSFIAMINDLPEGASGVDKSLFADDTMLQEHGQKVKQRYNEHWTQCSAGVTSGDSRPQLKRPSPSCSRARQIQGSQAVDQGETVENREVG
jgi:hypothetical protein